MKNKNRSWKKSLLIALIILFPLDTGFIVGTIHYQETSRNSDFPIIPRPSRLIPKTGAFILSSDFIIYVDNSSNEIRELGQYFADKLDNSWDHEIEVKNNSGYIASNSTLQLKLNSSLDILNEEGYNLEISEFSIEILAKTPTGIFHGLQTLLQLFPPSIEKQNGLASQDLIPLACVQIQDNPRFPYRGMHLDVGRHFFPVSFIKKYIDLLALYKFNTFHWHLTEDQGWRVEIKNYSKLTEVGAYRTDNKGVTYGGFYTQNEIREMVEYAAKRYITIIPEIEMPGHSLAALASYPELSCTGGPFNVPTNWGIYEDVFCAGNDAVFEFLENVLLEIMDLFPSHYIHIGGDECAKIRWKTCPKCQTRIMEEGLHDENDLQNYFISRINDFLQFHNRSLIGWNEIIEGGLVENATVMAWNSWDAAIEAARSHHDVIMTPTDYCYFDYYQGNPQSEPKAIGGYTPLSKVYAFEPIPPELNSEEEQYIIGAQGNVWTEYIQTPSQVEYMSVPRLCALAEVVWSDKCLKDWNHFESRLWKNYELLNTMDVTYSLSSLLPYNLIFPYP